MLVGLELLNTVYDLKVARAVKKEPITWEKFERVFGKIVGTLLTLMAVKNAINSYAYYRVLADVIFDWLFSAGQAAQAGRQDGGLEDSRGRLAQAPANLHCLHPGQQVRPLSSR